MKKDNYIAKSDYYKDEATSYDERRFSSLKGRIYENLQKQILKNIFAEFPKGFSALDMPCGTGRVGETLLEFTDDITCGDISVDMLDVARKKLSVINDRIKYKIIDGENIDSSDEQFDLVMSIKLMHLLPYHIQTKVLREIVRVSRKWIVVSYAYSGPLSVIKDYIFLKKYNSINPSSDYPRSIKDLRKEFKEAGCTVKRLSYTFRLFSSELIVFLEKQ